MNALVILTCNRWPWRQRVLGFVVIMYSARIFIRTSLNHVSGLPHAVKDCPGQDGCWGSGWQERSFRCPYSSDGWVSLLNNSCKGIGQLWIPSSVLYIWKKCLFENWDISYSSSPINIINCLIIKKTGIYSLISFIINPLCLIINMHLTCWR